MVEELSELHRLIENLVRKGTIAEVDLDAARCRVQSGNLTTTWLQYFVSRAGNVRKWAPPSVGEQCLIFSPGGDLCAGCVLVGLNSDANPAPDTSADIDSTTYPDGAVISYDHAASKLTATLPAGGEAEITAPVKVMVQTAEVQVNAATKVVVQSPDIELDAITTTTTGALVVNGLFTFMSGMAGFGEGPSGHGAEIQGTVKATDNVIAGSIPLVGHGHGNVENGEGVSGEAIPL
jgi:phage baseplate assembly protein V